MADNPGQKISRRSTLAGIIGIAAVPILGACTQAPATPAAQAQAPATAAKNLKAAFSNAGLGATWCAQGKEVAEMWGKWFGVDITWFDGALSVDKQRKAIDDMAAQKWDFVAIQPFGIGTLVDPVKRMIDGGTPVIQLDTIIAPPEANLNILTFLEPDNEWMGSQVTEELVKAIGGKGTIIETQGAAGHTGSQGRHRGFEATMKKYPDIKILAQDFADWDVNKVAKLWEDYLVKYPTITGGMFHNDDMALAAYQVIQNAKRDIKLVGVDAMPPAVEAVGSGKLISSVRNPSDRVHGWAVLIGSQVVRGQLKVADVPKYIHTDGPVVSKKNAAGMLFCEKIGVL
jgi:ribose transport system substrate-binding protein